MGMITECEAGGIPGNLVLPVVPWNAGWGDRKDGKVPARFDPPTGAWKALPLWQAGAAINDRRISDEWGCNAGLLCGQEQEGYVFVAVDSDMIDDLAGDNLKLRPILARNLATAFGLDDIMVRNTRPYRFGVLARIAVGGAVGGKLVIHLTYKDEENNSKDLGKIELLTRGEQFVIAGMHQSGVPITWSYLSDQNKEYRIPIIDKHIVTFPNFQAFAQAVMNALKPLERGRIFASSIPARSRALVGPSREPIDLAPIDVATFCDLVDRMPNPTDIDYMDYIEFWFALEGCRRSLRALGRLTPEDDLEMVRAGLDWCDRWEPPFRKRKATREEEMAQFVKVSLLPLVHRGWSHLKAFAVRLGITEISFEEAQREFADSDLIEPPPAVRLSKRTDPDPDYRRPTHQVTDEEFESVESNPLGLDPDFRTAPKRYRRGAIDVPLSDIQMADHVERELSGQLVWLSDEKRWLSHQGKRGWVGDETAQSKVEVEIEELLREYTAKWADCGPSASEKWTRSERGSALSTKRINDISKRLQSRFTKMRSQTDKGTYILQTPEGALDLRTGAEISEREQKVLLDTRCTNFAPSPGHTPLFDELLSNLSDGDPHVHDWLLHYLGYSLLGTPKARVFLFVWGTTGNGKSALVRIMSRILGNYVVTLNKDVLLTRGKEMHKTDLYRIRGARLACVVEMPPNEKWDEALIKAITGGDEISARPMRADARSFPVEATLLMVGNTIPAFDRVDQAIAARARITGTTFQPETADHTWEDRMVATEGAAIVAKLGGYAKKVFDRGLLLPDIPVAMLQRTRIYLGEQDGFYAWAAAELNTGYSARNEETPFIELKKRYEAFMKRSSEDDAEGGILGSDKITDKQFVAHLRGIGARLEESSSGQRYQRVVIADANNREVIYLVRGVSFKLRAVAGE